MSSEGEEYGGKLREYDEDIEEVKEGIDESHEDEEEYDSWDKRIAEEIADELKEQEEAEETARELAEEIEEQAAREVNEQEKEQDFDDIFEDIQDARDQQHDEFVHDMHEKCPAKEAFSEEASRYNEQEEESNETDESNDRSESYSDSGDGTMQVLSNESETKTTSDDIDEASDHVEELIHEKENGDGHEASLESNDKMQKTDQHPENTDGAEVPECEECEMGSRKFSQSADGKEESASRKQSTEQTTLDEFGNASSNDDSENLKDEATQPKENLESPSSEEKVESKKEDSDESDSCESIAIDPEIDESGGSERVDESTNHENVSDALEIPENRDEHLYGELESESTDNDLSENENEDNEALERRSDGDLEDDKNQNQQDENLGSEQDEDAIEEGISKSSEAEEDEQYEQTESDEDEIGLSDILEAIAGNPNIKQDVWSGELYYDEGPRVQGVIPETEEERNSRILREIWESLDEEERERIKDLLSVDIETIEALEDLLKRHSDLKSLSDYPSLIVDARNAIENENTDDANLVKILKSREAERRWGTLVRIALAKFSGVRSDFLPKGRRKLEKEKGINTLSETIIRSTLKKYEEGESWTSEMLASTLQQITKDSPGNVDLIARPKKGSTRYYSNWIAQIANQRAEVEDLLSKSDKEQHRIGVVGSNVYVWRRKLKELDYLEAFASAHFYFKSEFKQNLLERVKGALGGLGKINFSRLVTQITDYSSVSSVPRNGILTDFRHDTDFLIGETLRFIIDVLGIQIYDLQPVITHLGTRRQIANPKLMREDEFLELLVQIFASIVSDGHVDRNGLVRYAEPNLDRLEYVKNLFRQFGEVVIVDLLNEDGSVKGFRIHNVLGHMLERIGMTVGDKTLANTRLPSFLNRSEDRMLQLYLMNLTPEEGFVKVSKDKSRIRVGLNRSVALCDPSKGVELENWQLYRKLVSLIRRHGKASVIHIDHPKRYRIISVTGSKLKRLAKSSPIAKKLLNLVLKNPSTLLDDERNNVMNKLRIKTHRSVERISYSEATGRIVARWEVVTRKRVDAIRFALLAPPLDKIKRRKLWDAIMHHPVDVNLVAAELQAEGRTFILPDSDYS